MSMKDHKSKHKTITHCSCCKWTWAKKRREKKGSRRKFKQSLYFETDNYDLYAVCNYICPSGCDDPDNEYPGCNVCIGYYYVGGVICR